MCFLNVISLQLQNVSHGVETGFAASYPAAGADRAAREIHPVRGLVNDFDSFAVGGEQDRVFADDIARANV